ncbi:MAG: NAD(P)-binding protein, partial [Desulfomonilaceae bacterium]|nr:NAD(P)-binding protein [Desulfomonilaceae bacterium]
MQASGAASLAGKLIAEERGTLVGKKELSPEIDVAGQEPRIGVFICHCGTNIAGYLSVPDVVEYSKNLPDVVFSTNMLYACSEDSQNVIKDIIKEHNLNRVVVASCTPRTHEPLFRSSVREAGLNPYLFEMANIRDQCSWVHMTNPRAGTMKAKDLVRMAVAKSRLLEPLYGKTLKINKATLVIGGGLAGMTAAAELAEQGFEVHLVEKDKELGGNFRKIRFTLSGEDPQKKLSDTIERVRKNPNIHLYVEAKLTALEGTFGNFKSTVTQGDKTTDIQHGAIIVATGAK